MSCPAQWHDGNRGEVSSKSPNRLHNSVPQHVLRTKTLVVGCRVMKIRRIFDRNQPKNADKILPFVIRPYSRVQNQQRCAKRVHDLACTRTGHKAPSPALCGGFFPASHSFNFLTRHSVRFSLPPFHVPFFSESEEHSRPLKQASATLLPGKDCRAVLYPLPVRCCCCPWPPVRCTRALPYPFFSLPMCADPSSAWNRMCAAGGGAGARQLVPLSRCYKATLISRCLRAVRA